MTSATTSPDVRRRGRSLGFMENLTSAGFLLPILAVFTILFAVPLAQTVYYSFTDFSGYSTDVSFVGLENYRSGLLWRLGMARPEIRAGLAALGFSGPYRDLIA